MAAYNSMPESEIARLRDVKPPSFFGVEQSEAFLQWVWENFSAVAGDQPSFECWRESLFVVPSPITTVLDLPVCV